MREWKVFLNGQNYLFEWEGRKRKMGFYTTRFVEAETAELAKSVAIMAVRELPKLQIALNDPPIRHGSKPRESSRWTRHSRSSATRPG